MSLNIYETIITELGLTVDYVTTVSKQLMYRSQLYPTAPSNFRLA